jgi:hypothetical protein
VTRITKSASRCDGYHKKALFIDLLTVVGRLTRMRQIRADPAAHTVSAAQRPVRLVEAFLRREKVFGVERLAAAALGFAFPPVNPLA